MKGIYIGLIYSLLLIIVLMFVAIPIIADSIQTKDTLCMAAVIITVLIYFVFLILRRLLGTRIDDNSWRNVVVLFILSELIFVAFAGEFTVFGVLYKVGVFNNLDPDVAKFRGQRDFAFSISFLFSAFIAVGVRRVFVTKSSHPG